MNDKDKNTPGPDDIGKTVKLQSVLYLNTIKRQIFYKIYNSTLSMIQHMTRMSYLSKQGSIHSNLKFESHRNETNASWLKYPSEYHVDFQVQRNPKTEILDQLPKIKFPLRK